MNTTFMSILLQTTDGANQTAESANQSTEATTEVVNTSAPVEGTTTEQKVTTTEAKTQQSTESGWGNIIFIVAIVAIFYFFMIRPQSKRQKEIRKFRESMQQGDRVITAGGIHGKIKSVKENSVVLEIADGMNITVEKSSIYATAPDATEQPQK